MESKKLSVTCTCGNEVEVPIRVAAQVIRGARKDKPTREFMQRIGRLSRKKGAMPQSKKKGTDSLNNI